ncbi:14533_t:CDS:2 [Ambispora leptoticha]|uniref:14533_t:CDS:1 n=1 Tax=Ambispora leptoticha TaxID=144679 RepID=A0A9N8YU33_9GLOM|nr:14533_t:CDS:2 [Ambispora leptoticha]
MDNNNDDDDNIITSKENNLLKELLELFDELKEWGEPDERAVKQILKWISLKNELPHNIFQILSKHHRQNDPPCTCILGFFYNYGIGTPFDLERAFYLYRKSAEAGYLIAQNKVGYLNETMALYWGEKAARAGHPASQIQLALLYTYGVIVKRNITKAIYWCRKASEAHNNMSQHTLGGYYQSGIGVPRDIHMAIKLYRRAQNNDYEFTEISLNCLFKPALKE